MPWIQWFRVGAFCGVLAVAGCSPRGPEALRRGDELMAAGRPAEAIPYLERAVADLPGEAAAWNQLGLAYHASGRRQEAQKAYLRALNDDRNFFDAHYNLGTLEFEDGHWRESERSLRTYLGLEGNRTNVVAWRMLGDALLSSGQTDAAERALSTALQLAPDQSSVLNSLGMALASRRRFKDAQGRFQQAVRVNPLDAAAALNLAIVTQQLGDRRSALDLYRRYLSLGPEGPEVAGVRDLVRQLEVQFSPTPALATNRIAMTNTVTAAPPAPVTKAPTNAAGSLRATATNPAVAVRPPAPDRTSNAAPPIAKPAVPLVTAAQSPGPGARGATNPVVTPPPPVRPPEPSVPLEIVRVEEAPVLRAARDPAPAAAPTNRTAAPPSSPVSERPSASGTGTVG
ncbi:MAG: tetratricopeptide repeat protein, partial [Verrucomicrobia bacterium]|nr:tetratricopeptide repeat protein [Verrucomicrobiota bacterium]